MTHVTSYSPVLKVLYKYFMLLIIAMVVRNNYHGDKVIKESGEVIMLHEVTAVQINENIASNENKVLVQEVGKELEEHEDIKVEEKVVEKLNTIYYVEEDGIETYLDDCYQDYLYEMCIKYNVEDYYELLLAQMYHESKFVIDVISKTNDHGLMQINICNHEWLGEKFGNDDFLDPYNNIEAGVFLMSGFLHKYNDVEKALVCYNRGEKAVINGTYSTGYSKCVLSDMELLKKLEERKE